MSVAGKVGWVAWSVGLVAAVVRGFLSSVFSGFRNSPKLIGTQVSPEDLDKIRKRICSYLPSYPTYLCLIVDPVLFPYLMKIREFDHLPSAIDAVTLFWRYNRSEIEACLLGAVEILHTVPSGKEYDAVRAKKLSDVLDDLVNIVRRFLARRDDLAKAIKDGQLELTPKLYYLAYPALGLLASSHLRILNLSNKPIQDLKILAGLTNMIHLSLERTLVSNLWPLSDLQNLRRLQLENTPVQDLRTLSGLLALEALHLHGSLIDDLSPLSPMLGLQLVTIAGTDVCDLRPLLSLAGLIALDMRDTLVTDLSLLPTSLVILCITTQLDRTSS